MHTKLGNFLAVYSRKKKAAKFGTETATQKGPQVQNLASDNIKDETQY